jgi:cold shock CspA family protein
MTLGSQDLYGRPTQHRSQPELEGPFREHFTQMGCRIDVDEDYKKLYCIDFGVSRVRGVHAAVNLGLHITRDTDNFARQEVFLEAARKGVVSKSVYVEVCAASVETGVIPVTYAACLAFLFDRRYHHARATGLRIFEDCSFHFFDLEENVRRLRKDIHDAAHAAADLLNGQIIAYFSEKGFGFIEDVEHQKFFFHIANVVDDSLRQSLPSYTQGEIIPVRFCYGGSDGKKYPKAIEVSGAPAAARAYDDDDDGDDDDGDDDDDA